MGIKISIARAGEDNERIRLKKRFTGYFGDFSGLI